MSRDLAPAFYVSRGRGWARDVWAVLHPPYTLWHLSYVAIGAGLAPALSPFRLAATFLAFGLAVGVAAHALDELHGRPLGTELPDPLLAGAAGVSLALAVALGLAGVTQVGPGLLAFIALGSALVVGYNLELFGGRLHDDRWFSFSWGAFPVLTGYFAQTGRLAVAPVLAAAAAYALSSAQRSLSTPARLIRRRAREVSGRVILDDGETIALDSRSLLTPLEGALAALTWSPVLVAGALIATRLA